MITNNPIWRRTEKLITALFTSYDFFLFFDCLENKLKWYFSNCLKFKDISWISLNEVRKNCNGVPNWINCQTWYLTSKYSICQFFDFLKFSIILGCINSYSGGYSVRSLNFYFGLNDKSFNKSVSLEIPAFLSYTKNPSI